MVVYSFNSAEGLRMARPIRLAERSKKEVKRSRVKSLIYDSIGGSLQL